MLNRSENKRGGGGEKDKRGEGARLGGRSD